MNIQKAKTGNVWRVKETKLVLSDTLYLGINDTIDRYEEVDISEDDNMQE